jgi:hypothetical protein
MSRFCLAVALLISGFCFSQDSNNAGQRQDTSRGMSINYDSLQKQDIQRSVDKSVSAYADLQQRNAEEKKKAITYVVLGVLFLVVLMVGLTRKRKVR